jgi:2-polyprenyl-6-methoxyphenol hydroxylase-like FAD-dependent oxidoreductase
MGKNATTRHIGGTAVVLGASMAGLCAARVLADRFDQVLVFDRDELPDGPEHRRLVPQGRHPHLLMKAGERLLERWFPGFTEELVAGGAVPVDLNGDLFWWDAGGPARRPTSDLVSPAMSRPFLEHTVRSRVAALPGVTIRDGAAVSGLATDAGGDRITGVHLEDGTVVAADLVVDASGRQARSLAWVERLGYQAPPVSQVHIDTTYVSGVYQRSEGSLPDWKGAGILGEPETRKQINCMPMEGNRWIIVIAGFNGLPLPTEHHGMLAMARSFESQAIADVMANAEPLGPLSVYRFPANQRRRLEKMRRVPLGWVLLGDAVCAFDPVYGQGMSSAAQQAEALGVELDRAGAVDRRFARRYFKAASRIVSSPWSVAAGGGFAYPATTGDKPVGTDLLNRYARRVTIAGHHDDVAAARFKEVAAMVRPPESLMSPLFMARVLWASRKGPAGDTAPVADDAGAAIPAEGFEATVPSAARAFSDS